MTKKRLERFANKIYALELKFKDDNLSADEKRQIEIQIEQIIGGLLQLPDGFNLIGQIDEIIQKKFAK